MEIEMCYIESESIPVQGNRDEIYRKYYPEWNIRELGGGCGNWLLTKKADVLVNGVSYRSFILNHYGRVKLTRSLFEKFREDVKNGKIKL